MGSLEYTNAATDQGRAASKAERTKPNIFCNPGAVSQQKRNRRINYAILF